MSLIESIGVVPGILSIIAGVMVILWSRIIAFIVGVSLIVLGVIVVIAA